MSFWFIGAARPANALDPGRAVTQYAHKVWLVEDGLPQNTVRALVQTRDGYLWLGTQEGLARFDGVRFTVYNPRNAAGLKGYSVQALYEDDDGVLWVGTNRGLSRLRDGVFTCYTSDDGLASDNILAIHEGQDRSLWVGTIDGLSRFKDGSVVNYTTANALPHNQVRTLLTDRAGNLWIGTRGGLVRFRDERFTTYTAKEGMAADSVWCLYEDASGNLWVGTQGGLSRLRDGVFTNFTNKGQEGLSYPTVSALCGDREGNLWVGTQGGGLNRLSGGVFTVLDSKHSLSDDIVRSLYEDREGNLWVGGTDGLNRLRDGKFLAYTTAEGLSHDAAWTFGPARGGGVWIGTFDGWNLLRDGHITSHLTKDILNLSGITAIHEDRVGNLWLGTNGELYRVRDGKVVRTYTAADGLPAKTGLTAIHETPAGELWIGTQAGLCRLRGERFDVYSKREGLLDDNILTVHEDREGNLWVGSRTGLTRLRGDKFTTIADAPRLPVLTIHDDADGTIWLGTEDGGLYRLRDGRFTAFTSKDGLYDDSVHSILEDAYGNLWMGSNTGIFRVSRAELDDYAAGKRSSFTSQSYDTADGMKSRECARRNASGWKSADGRLWFATTKGVAVVDPSRLGRNEQPPPVVIERVTADGQTYPNGKVVRLAAGTERLDFEYTGLSFTAPEKVRFRYKLVGYDRGWVEAGTRRAAYYTNLPAGSYTFHVMACNNDGLWNEAGAQLAFTLLPRFHQTHAFYLLCLALAALATWAFYRLRLRQVRSRFALVMQERTRVAREMHDTLIQSVAGTISLLDAAAQTINTAPHAAGGLLNEARAHARESLTEAREAVWNMRHQVAGDEGLGGVLARDAARLTAGTGVAVEVKTTGAPRELAPETTQNLARIAQEAVTNSVKHAGASKVRIELSYERRHVRVGVRDDGRGFDTNETSPREAPSDAVGSNGVASGGEGPNGSAAGRATANGAAGDAGGGHSGHSRHFGLTGMRERAAEVGGRLVVYSRPGEGTRVDVRVRG